MDESLILEEGEGEGVHFECTQEAKLPLLWAIDIPIGILSKPLGELTDGMRAVVAAEIAVTSDVTNDPMSGSKTIINTFVPRLTFSSSLVTSFSLAIWMSFRG